MMTKCEHDKSDINCNDCSDDAEDCNCDNCTGYCTDCNAESEKQCYLEKNKWYKPKGLFFGKKNPVPELKK